MAVQFICGGAGYGKTHLCIEKIKKDRESGFYTVMIVPEQTSLSVENRMIAKLSYLSSEQDVLSFARLFYRIYKEVSGARRDSVDTTGKTMLLSKILLNNESKLSVFGGRVSAAGDLLTTISEFKRYGASPEDIAKGIQSSDLLSGKLADISYIYREYEREIESLGEDSDDNARIFTEIAHKSEFLKNTCIYIDGFSTFTPAEISIISALDSVCRAVYITLKADLSGSMLFAPADDMKIRIAESVSHVLPDIKLTENYKHHGNMLFFEKNYGRYGKSCSAPPCDEIEIHASESPAQEVDFCARDILCKIRENGYSYKDIGVITGNGEDYIPLIRRSFELHGIRFFADMKKNTSSHPLCGLILSLCNIFINNFSSEDVFEFLKTGLTALSDEDIDLLENYVLETGISGNKWNTVWEYKGDKHSLDRINKARKYFLELIMPFRNATKGRSSAKEYTQALITFLNNAEIPKKVEEISQTLINSGRKQEASEYRQVYNKIAKTLLQLELCMGDYTFGIARFYDMIKSGFSEIKIATLPPEQDCIAVGEYERTRFGNIKLLYVLGANDGVFPPSFSGTGVISDTERRMFEKNGIEIAPDNRRKALERPFKIYETLTSASERLVLCYSLASVRGESLRPSRILTELEKLFPNLKKADFLSEPEISYISTPRATLKQLFARGADEVWADVENYLAQDNDTAHILDFALSASSLSLNSKLSSEIALALWGKELRATVTRLETFAKCPFKFFATYGLSLKEREVYDFAPVDSGNFVHKIMEDFVNKTVAEGNVWSDISFSDCVKIADTLSENAFSDIKDKLPLLTKRHEFIIKRLKKSAADALWAVTNHIKSGVFRPYAAELEFEDDSAVPPYRMTTPAGNTLILYGKVDRIDSDGANFRIIDYKSSAHDLNLSDVYNGVSLQLFIYSAALKDKVGKPAGMFYLTVNTPLIELESGKTAEEIEKGIVKAFRLSGYMVGDTDTVYKMDENISGWSDIVSARLTQKGLQTTRLLSSEQYSALEREVIERTGELGDRIIGGQCSASPLIQKNGSACDYCPYSSVCRFEESEHEYRRNDTLSDSEIFENITKTL